MLFGEIVVEYFELKALDCFERTGKSIPVQQEIQRKLGIYYIRQNNKIEGCTRNRKKYYLVKKESIQ